MEKAHTYIESLIKRKKEGALIFPTDFRGVGTEDAIKKALSRLAQNGALKRLAHGIYYIPKHDPLLGELHPGAEEVIRMLAKKEKIRIRPSGAYALNKLGLSTQVPTRLVYITDGPPKQFRLGKLQVKFKSTTPKKLSTIGEYSSLLIQALEEIGTENISPRIESKILELIKKEAPKKLQHDLTLASGKVNDYIVKLLKKMDNDQLAETN
ncbi:MAG: hypothetical protein J7578_08550 [Chitinophagaceae bacterium]|nr:hypothetical protein [Chitinophagaceae bacterium]